MPGTVKTKYLIHPHLSAKEIDAVAPGDGRLDVMEFFCDSLQGEGVYSGCPSTFLRLQGCTLDCQWCDTQWRLGHTYSFAQLFDLMESFEVIDKLNRGQHLVITGGSPLKQQNRIVAFLLQFEQRYRFSPFVEIENECTLIPSLEITGCVDAWDNSPKLAHSGMKKKARIKPEVLKLLSTYSNSWFKFVVRSRVDWNEIAEDFLDPGYIKQWQVILMPLADDLDSLRLNRELVADLAIKNGVRYSSREQIVLNKP